MLDHNLVGVGLYTPQEAQDLIGVPASRLRRWLSGYAVGDTSYDPLWNPQVELGDGSVHLGFRDLIEARTAHEFMKAGISAQAIRKAISRARELIEDGWPLSTARFRTDGKSIFLQDIREDGDTRLIDVLKGQYAFSKVMERSLLNVEFDGGRPSQWWVAGRGAGIVIDPNRSFGQPIDDKTGVPTAVLAEQMKQLDDAAAVARFWEVSERAVKSAFAFEMRRQSSAT